MTAPILIVGGGIVVEHRPLPDGRSNIVVVGQARLRLEEVDDTTELPYRRARATLLADLPHSVPESDRTALVAAATMFASEVKKHDDTFRLELPSSAPAAVIADACASQLVVDPGARQAMLEELDPRLRVRMVMKQLAVQHGAMLGDAPDRVLN